MANGEISRLLNAVNLQMAAEGFLVEGGDNGLIRPVSVIRARLVRGNEHTSRFTPTQADQFVTDYTVLAQYRNDPLLPLHTGFSGTLFKSKNGELTLSFRSTEFIDDNIRDSASTNDLEVKDLGWALGQIAEMEDWYATLRADPNLIGEKHFNVTGYSLGGHLATAFNILRREEAQANVRANPIIATYTFNGAGVGDLKPGVKLGDVLAKFRRYLGDPELTASDDWGALTEAQRVSILNDARDRAAGITREYARVAGLTGITYALQGIESPVGVQATVHYQIAAVLAARDAYGAGPLFIDGLFKNPTEPKFADSIGRTMIPGMTEVVGSDGGNLGPAFVSNSGIHYGSRKEIYIEDQPLTRGNYLLKGVVAKLVSNPSDNDFADTHSLVLLQDSLSLMAAFERLDPAFTSGQARQIFQAMSSAKASRFSIGTQGFAEGDVLERALDAVREIFFGPGTTPTVAYGETLAGNTWHESRFRDLFHANLKALNDRISGLSGELSFAPRIEVLAGRGADELQALSESPAIDSTGYRYALRKLNPFAVLGLGYAQYNGAGELDLYDADTGSGVSDVWIEARSAFLRAYSDYRIADGDLSQRAIGGYFEDQALNVRIGMSTEFFQRFIFASDVAPQPVEGFLRDDFLFGGTGADTLSGGWGDDYLESGPGDDTLTGGRGSDELDGGKGFDTYVFAAGDGGDSIFDFDGLGRIFYQGRELSGGTKRAEGVYEDADGVRFQLVDEGEGERTLIVDGSLRVEDFSDGALGLFFDGDLEPDAIPESTAAHTYFDSDRPDDFDPHSGPFAFLLDHYGSEEDDAFSITTAAPAAGRGGNDSATYERGDTYTGTFDMGSGDDFVDAGASSGAGAFSFIAGGGGSDYLVGGQGDDRLWGDSYFAFSGEVFFGAGSRSAGVFFIDGLIYNLNAAPGFPQAGLLPQGYGAFKKNYDVALLASGSLESDYIEALIADGAFVHGSLADAVVAVVGAAAEFDDYIDAGEGDDYVVGGSGSDDILGGAGDDLLFGDYETAGATRSRAVPSYAGLVAHFGALASLFGRPGDDLIDGGEGDDEIRDFDGGNDVLLGGEGNDVIGSREALWTPESGEGAQNTIHGGAGDDEIDSTNETGGFDLVDGGEGDDAISVYAGPAFGVVDADGVASPGRAFVYGGAGNDVLLVEADDGFVDGGSGDDDYTVYGQLVTVADSSGNDTLHLELPDLAQVDAWLATFPGDLSDAPWRDEFALSQSWTIMRVGRDLVISTEGVFDDEIEGVVEARTEVVIERWFAGPSNRIENTFTSYDGGAALSAVQLEAWGGLHYGGAGADELSQYGEHADRSIGGDGDDVILTGGGADFLYGGRGDDDLVGGAGDDMYAYASGDGNDVLEDVSGLDEIRLGPGLTIAAVAASIDDDGLVLTVGAGRIEIAGAGREDPGVERLRFFDGTTALVAGLLPPLPQTALVARTFEAGPDDPGGGEIAEPGAPDTSPPATVADEAGALDPTPSATVVRLEGGEDDPPGTESSEVVIDLAVAEQAITEDPAVSAEGFDGAVGLPLPVVEPSLRQLFASESTSETSTLVAQAPREPDSFTAFALAIAGGQQISTDFLRVTIAQAAFATDDDVPDRPSRGGSPIAPLDLQTLAEAVEAFDAGVPGAPGEVTLAVAGPPQSADRGGQPSAGPPEVNSWVLTNALLQFHLEQAGAGDAPGADGGAPSPLLEALSVPLARQSLSLQSFGQQAPSLATFSGLQEGFTRL